ncbi:VOC family protein [Psychromicrobium lacuslunae]|uniref:VOC domain-containing protein n=1 Tax=Psychromicrobium lacuslunae TaxID=1618207 RepID=A0A0D4C193_9MICC|nr:hypothetical protein [Psychromicrobium lacuslunae]AJT42160.1 hypothetical protein UM93_12780 [Psychromicrobium lacuslunae]
MLRVRPIHFTSRVQEFSALFDALGLVRVVNDVDWLEFDAGSGSVALHRTAADSTDDGVTYLGFQVKDLDVFAERTRVAGSQAEILQEAHGRTAKITARDGLEFMVDPTDHLETVATANPQLSVNALWYTPEVAAAAQDLGNIGAIPVSTAKNGQFADFKAKNGGKVLVHIAEKPAHGGLGFGYHGKLEVLLERLQAHQVQAHIIDESYGRTLHLSNPDYAELPNNPTGATIWINEEDQEDHYGYLKH